MKIESRVLAKLDMVYSITTLPAAGGGLPAFAAGSEGAGGDLIVLRPPAYAPERIGGAPGGYMSLQPLTWAGRPWLVASTRFLPVFQGQDCRLMAYPLDTGPMPEPVEIAHLPFTHRISVRRIGDATCLLASTLCSGKRDRDDWTQPGGVLVAAAPAVPTPGTPWPFRPVITGLNKNHGFDAAVLTGGRSGYLVSCREGLSFLQVPGTLNGAWNREIIAVGEYSDAIAFPWYDGEPVVFSISPFHGHQVKVHQRGPKGWTARDLDQPLEFGHVLWAGAILGEPGILLGGRAGAKDLVLLRKGAELTFRRELIAADIAPTQIAVADRGRAGSTIIVSAPGRAEVIRYDLSP